VVAKAGTTTASGSVTATTTQGRQNARMPNDPTHGQILGSEQDSDQQDRVNPKDLPANEDDLPANVLSDANEEDTDLHPE